MAKKRKNRRIKKTKYLSLRLQFSSSEKEKEKEKENEKQMATTSTSGGHLQQIGHLLNNDCHDDSMEYLLSASDGGATTLTGLLDSAGAIDDGGDELSASASVTYASEAMKLVRTALRSRERESSSEERYVRYSEVVDDQRRDHEEVSSRVGVSVGVGGGDYWYNDNNKNKKKNEKMSTMVIRRLSLKLDYQEILNAWSDKGDLYIHSDFPQTVPDINHHFSSHPMFPMFPIPILNGEGLWSVPEENGGEKSKLKTEEEEEEVVGGALLGVGEDEEEQRQPEEWKCQREASVLRYKEKRRNRLFSKTIRYQVRKENAQKRPRVKGRFVKRS